MYLYPFRSKNNAARFLAFQLETDGTSSSKGNFLQVRLGFLKRLLNTKVIGYHCSHRALNAGHNFYTAGRISVRGLQQGTYFLEFQNPPTFQ